jgi:uncharacterized protein with von Willebrand factor type A (vWA) domain
MSLDLGKLLRLREMIRSASTSVDADGDGAAALTQSYARLRASVRDVVIDSNADPGEFDAAFPEIDVVELPDRQHPRKMAMRKMEYAPHAKRAQALLGQLAGWVNGLIEEMKIRQDQTTD